MNFKVNLNSFSEATRCAIIQEIEDLHFLTEVLKNGTVAEKKAALENPNITTYMISRRVEDESFEVRLKVAGLSRTKSEDLDILANDVHWKVRRRVIDNPNTLESTRKRLLNDICFSIRKAAEESIE